MLEPFFAFIIILFLIVAFFFARQARRMGYSGILWFIVFLLANPIIVLGVLAGLPDRSIEKRRKVDMELLDKQLAQRGLLQEASQSTIPRQTISDDTTVR